MLRRMLTGVVLTITSCVAIPVALTPASAPAGASPPAGVKQCKDGGWQTLTDASGRPFKNQGQCIAYAIHHRASLPPIRHVFVIMLENNDYSATFGNPSADPYLATTLPSEGALLKNYYGIGHFSNDNYAGFISGQPPNSRQPDRLHRRGYVDFPPGRWPDQRHPAGSRMRLPLSGDHPGQPVER